LEVVEIKNFFYGTTISKNLKKLFLRKVIKRNTFTKKSIERIERINPKLGLSSSKCQKPRNSK